MSRWTPGDPAFVKSPELVGGVNHDPPLAQPKPSPPAKADLKMWYDATQLSLSDGGSISTWTDATGNGHDLTGTAATYRTGQINGKAVGRFDGVDDHLEVTFAAVSEPFTVAFVGQLQNPNSGSGEVAVADAGGSTPTFFSNKDDQWDQKVSGSSDIDGGADDSNVHVFTVQYDGGGSYFNVDGSQTASGTSDGAGMDGFGLGARGDGTQPGQWDIGEVLFYPMGKKSIEADIESYLGGRWGVTV